MLDARKSEVYTALYHCDELPRMISGDCVTAPASFLQRIDRPTLFVGSGALRYRDLITDTLGDLALFAPSVCHMPRASSGALLAMDKIARGELLSAAELLPVYIRPSEAELARMSKDSAG
jgi:tRNA threonylcarbamoyladenosine biosynthesis protein TsaB